MEYEKAIEFDGDVEKAFEVAKSTFLPHGFQVISINDTDLEVEGPGTFREKGQDPLVGISKARISIDGSNLLIKAELGGITKTIKFLTIFIITLAVFLLVLFWVLFVLIQGQSMLKIFLISLAPLAPWPVAVPLMGRYQKNQTCRAIDALMKNMVTLGK